MKSKDTARKRSIIEFLYIMGSMLVLLPLFYAISSLKPSWPNTIAYLLILYPTLLALINGAPFVPTPMPAVLAMLEAAKLKPGQKVYDIGCGDGRVVHQATKKYDVKAVGFELSPFVYLLARIRHFFWQSKAKIKFGNFKRHDLSDADVIFCYLLPDTLQKLYPKLNHELQQGAKIVSYAFPIAQWEEHEKVPANKEERIGPIWIYQKS